MSTDGSIAILGAGVGPADAAAADRQPGAADRRLRLLAGAGADRRRRVGHRRGEAPPGCSACSIELRHARPAGAGAPHRRLARRRRRGGRALERLAAGLPADRASSAPRTGSSARALARVLAALGIDDAAAWIRAHARHPRRDVRAGGAVRSSVPVAAALAGHAFAWAEAITSAAVRLVPLGQSAGQRLLAAAGAPIPASSTARSRCPTTRSARRRRGRRSPAPGTRRCTRGCFAHEQPPDTGLDDQTATVARRRRRPGRARARPRWSTRSASALRDRFDIAVVTNDIYTKEDAQFLVRSGALADGTDRRRRDRRLPAHRDPRGRLDQPRGDRRAGARASRRSTW